MRYFPEDFIGKDFGCMHVDSIKSIRNARVMKVRYAIGRCNKCGEPMKVSLASLYSHSPSRCSKCTENRCRLKLELEGTAFDGLSMVFMKASVEFKNNTNKVAKDVAFTLLLFDKNGYPVSVEYDIYSGKYENAFNCISESCNIQTGGKFGKNWEYSIPARCSKAKACVRAVEYKDGSTWNNPYHDFWIDDSHASY